jgi:hypothetical protein
MQFGDGYYRCNVSKLEPALNSCLNYSHICVCFKSVDLIYEEFPKIVFRFLNVKDKKTPISANL